MAKQLVRTERDGDVALIVIDSPPVNALSTAMRRELQAAIRAAEADQTVQGSVIACDGRTFVAGADIREFDSGGGREAGLPEICAALDDARKPFVAAMHGTALGGGFELALCCHARVLATDGRVGLPEVRIGVMPGSGGTQRLPRMVGVPAALEIITSGRHLAAEEALKLGIVDEVAGDIRAASVARARALAARGTLPRIRDRVVPPIARAEAQAAVAAATRRARGAIAPGRAAEAVLWSLDVPFDDAVRREREMFMQLRDGPQSRALRHIFHAERVAARAPSEAEPRPLRRMGVVGGGTMGSGIAIAMADAGLPVTLVEVSQDAVRAAEGRVRTVYDRQAKSGRLSTEEHQARLARVGYATDLAALSDCDLVVEAVIEELPAKQAVFRNLSAAARRDAVLASNTSYLDINLLADVVDAPERVLGLHFFSPAHVMRLLEIVDARRTAPDVLASGLALAKRIGKQPVVSGVCDGFIGNRIFARWRQQCDFALEDGALPQDVDAAIEAYGFAMGPYAVGDLAGLDIGWATRKRLAPTRDPRFRYVPIADWICEQGRFGQKTNAGYYRHENGKRVVDPAVTALVERASAARGISRRAVPAEEIQQRVHAAMVDEAARILAEGIARRPSDIDVVLVNGYGYPAWRGGPMHEADVAGLPEMLRRAEAVCASDGLGREPAPLLRELAEGGRRFADLNA
ncbi:MAG: enoyl-CoA hydratase/isomerase family protein [Acidisphaera sp.]|nr:enoyl-CoA hydratase/isomerase family protein [Acidisphaera sp.]MBV9812542.1 enoyl-CoA hydratase/isomerase family protein [Acetobacteraceae bacterium]